MTQKNNFSNKINFNWIKVQNFLSIGSEIFIDFNNNKGTTYIYGWNRDLDCRNGSGKSSLMIDSILWVLFNKTCKNIKVGNIPHRLHQNNCQVQINFIINNIEYEITRGLFPHFIKLTKDGVDLTKSSIKETYSFIESEVLKSTFNLFKNSLVLSINDAKNLFKMSKHEKRLFIEDLLDFSIYGKMFIKVRDDNNILERELNLEQRKYKSLKENILDFKINLDKFDSDKQNSIDKLNKELNLILEENKSKELQDNSVILEKLKKSLTLILDKQQIILNSVNELKNEINNLKINIKHRQKYLLKYEKIIKNICNTCKTKIDTFLNWNETELLINKEKECLIKKETEFKKIKIALEEKDNLLLKLKEQIKKIEIKQEKFLNHIQNNKIINSKINDIKNKIKDEKSKKSPFYDLIKTYLVKLNESKEILKEYSEKSKYLEFLKFILSEEGVKKYLIKDIVNLLNNRIRKYLEDFGCEYTIVFDNLFNFIFLTTTGECEYDSFSSGEKRRIDLALMFSFRDLLFGRGTLQSNILICDEILDISIDNIAIKNIIKLLKTISEHQNVFLISHRECINPEEFSRILKVVKENNYTRLLSKNEQENEEETNE